MEEIKAPKKERKFLKAIGNIGKVLAKELVMGIARKFIGKVVDKVKLPKKRETLSILLLLSFTIAFAQFPNTGNKQRLGFQTSADGLVWRGSISDTASIQPVSNQNAWLIIDTVNLKIYSFDFTSNIWGLVGGGTSGLTMPFDSITFNTAKDGTVGVGEVEYNDTQGSLIQGLKGGLVTNVIGQQLHQRVNNRTGATLAKGTAVYLSGSQGNRITVAKALGVTDAFSANTFGIIAESIANNQSGYVITEGLITGINTSSLIEDSAVYLSPTVAGGLTSTKPQAPQHTVYIGVCVKSNAGSGELFVKIRNGQELDELHDVRISNPLNNASLFYKSSEGIWRDTTPTLLVSDTATMLANYATKAYADTSGRFYARQDFTNVSSSTLTWTQSDTLVVGGTGVVQVYRNGQILLPTQYTIPTKTTVVIGATAYKLGENYTVIFPRGGGGGGSGSGSLTSISGGTGITVSPNPITTTGTVSADLSVLMELTDTTLLNLTSRFASKLNLSDTISLSNRINTKGSGTVTSIATGYGLSGGTITTTGTLRLDSATVFNRIRDSIVDVAIGNDTIKILKQEYSPALTSILTWTITPKFPIQLKAYILVFRNGQLLNNDQYNLTDTNKITIVSTSFKIGSNYTVATVSGIGSVGSSQAGNPIYPEAGIALSTGTTWASSITNNSSNWNTAFTDRLKWDGGSTGLVASTGRTSLGGTTIGQSMFTLTNPSAITYPQFNADNTITALSAASFRSAIGASTVTSVIASTTAGNPISITNTTTTPTIELLSATSARNGYLTSTDWTTFNNKQAALGFTPANSTITIGTTAPLQGGGNLTANRTLSITQATTSADGFLTSTDWNTFNAKQNTLVSGTTIKTVNNTTLLGSGNLSVGTLIGNDTVSLSNRINLKVNISDTAAMLLPYLKKVDTTSMLTPYFRDNDTTSLNLTSRLNTKLNISDTASMLTNYKNALNTKLNITDTTLMLSKYLRKLDTITLSNRINLKVNISDTASMLTPYFRDNDTTLLNLSSRFIAKVNLSDTLNMLAPYLRKADTTNMLLPYFRDTDTTSLNLTNRFNTKLNITDTTLMLSKYLRKLDTITLSNRINLKLNISDTASMLTPYFRDNDTTLLNLSSRLNTKLNISDTTNMLLPYLRKLDTTNMLLPYLRKADTSLLNLTSRFSTKLNISDTTNMLSRYLRKADTTSMLLPYFRDADTTSLNLTNRFATKLNYTDTSFLFTQSDTNQLNLTSRFLTKLNISDTLSMLSKYLRRADTTLMLLPYLRKVDTTSMLLPYFKDTDTSILNLTSRLNTKLNISDTTSMLLPYLRKADTTIMLLPYFKKSDTTSLNLTSRFATKLNISDTLNMLTPYLRKSDTTNMLVPYFRDADTTSLNLTSRFAAKQNILNGTGFVKASGPNITYDNSSYLTTSSAASTYLPLTGGTLTGALNGTKLILNSGIDVFGDFSTSYHTNVSALFRGYQVLVAPNIDYGQTRIHFPNRPVDDFYSDFGSGIRHKWAGSDARNSFLSLYTSNNANLQIDALSINDLGNVGIMDTTPSYTLDVNGTLGVAGAATFISTSRFVGNVAINTTTAYKPLEVHTNANDYVSLGVRELGLFQFSGIHFGYAQLNELYRKSAIVFQRKNLNDASGSIHILNTELGQGERSADLRDAKLTITNGGNVGINDTTPSYTLDVNGTLNVTGAATLSSTLAVQGDITENGNNVMTNLDTVSLSNRINTKYNSSGGTISGEVTLSTTTAAPTSLLGKDGSNVVGTVTTVAQTGLMTRNIVTNASTISGSELINVSHGLGSEPTSVLLTVFGSTSYILQVASKSSSTFTVQVKNYDGTPAINAILISFSWLAIK